MESPEVQSPSAFANPAAPKASPAASGFGANVVQHAPGRHLDQPGAGIRGNAFLGPLESGRQQSLLDTVFGGGEIAEAANGYSEHLGRKFAQQVLEAGR